MNEWFNEWCFYSSVSCTFCPFGYCVLPYVNCVFLSALLYVLLPSGVINHVFMYVCIWRGRVDNNGWRAWPTRITMLTFHCFGRCSLCTLASRAYRFKSSSSIVSCALRSECVDRMQHRKICNRFLQLWCVPRGCLQGRRSRGRRTSPGPLKYGAGTLLSMYQKVSAVMCICAYVIAVNVIMPFRPIPYAVWTDAYIKLGDIQVRTKIRTLLWHPSLDPKILQWIDAIVSVAYVPFGG